MSLKTAYEQLAVVIADDPGMVAWVASVKAGATLTVLKGNREVKRIDVKQLPALVLELGEWPLSVEVHGHHSGGTHQMKASVVWHGDDEATATDRALELPEVITQAVMANPTLNSTVDGAWVSHVSPDQGYNHPRHSMGFTISADLMISR